MYGVLDEVIRETILLIMLSVNMVIGYLIFKWLIKGFLSIYGKRKRAS